jgi:type II secretory pathway component PulF
MSTASFLSFFKPNPSRFLRYKTSEQAALVKRLALYLHSGISLTRALTFIIEDTNKRGPRYILSTLERTVSVGSPLSNGFAQFPKIFDPFTIGFMRTGEASGRLTETLEHIAAHLKHREQLRRKITSALAYPGIILMSSICMAVFLTLFIFPKIVPVLKGFHTTLPFSTRMLIWINTLVSRDWLWIIIVCLFFIVAISVALRTVRLRRIVERILLQTPIAGSLCRYYAVVTFARTLSLQLSGGIQITSALTLTRSTLSGSLYPMAVLQIEKRILEGARLSTALYSDSKLFPPLLSQMIAAGEATGTLGANLSEMDKAYEEKLDELTKNLTVLVEPVLMIAMGGIVGFIALAIITPIYQVTQNLHT